MRRLGRISALLRELADEIDALDQDDVRPKRRPAQRQPRKLALVPNDLQRLKARQILASKGIGR